MNVLRNSIDALQNWEYACYPAEAEFIEATIRLTESKTILEVGMFRGFTTLHMIRAALDLGGTVTSVDMQRIFPEDVFKEFIESGLFTFVQGHTPEILETLHGQCFDFVFLDSDHTPEHTEKELRELFKITRSGSIFLLHDLPLRTAENQEITPIRKYIDDVLQRGLLKGVILPSCYRRDMAEVAGKEDYDRGINPHMGVFIRP